MLKVVASGAWLLCLSMASLSTAADGHNHGVSVSRSDKSGGVLAPFFHSAAVYPRLTNTTSSTNSTSDDAALLEALRLVQDASKQQGDYNAHRVANPRRNEEVSKDSPAAQAARRKRAANAGPRAPTLTPALRRAAALVAEHQAKQQANATRLEYPQPKHLEPRFSSGVAPGGGHLKARVDSSYWLQDIKHTGLAPMGANSSWPVFRDVTDPTFAGGAKGDGVHDDTEAINAAIAYGGNCGEGCLSSSIKGTLIYFPPGRYLVSSPISAMYYSQLVGNANDLPVITTSKDFIGLGAIQSDVYIPNQNGDEWYIEQSNFYRQVRNFIIDIRHTATNKTAAFHWQVAQATSMTNVRIYAGTDAGTTQIGLFTENGSGGFMSDVYINGGKYGIYGGNQQYTVRHFEIESQTDSCIALIWDWGWTWYNLFLAAAPTGFNLLNPEADGKTRTPTGAIYVMDSLMSDLTTGIKTNILKKDIEESTIIQLDNVDAEAVGTMISTTDGSAVPMPVGSSIGHVVVGNVKIDGQALGRYSIDVGAPPRTLLDPDGDDKYARAPYFTRKRPQYEGLRLADVVSVKDHGAKGDGVTDDTAAINAVLAIASASNLIYFPAGSYIVTATINVPAYASITGEVWSQIVASGSYFADMKNPKPMVKVGNKGDKGIVEISDMLFTSVGALPGLVLMEWNVAAERQGSAAMFDAHFRVGGAYGSKLSLADCPKVTSIPSACVAASMLLHVTPEADGYFENVWGWVADHDIDDPTNTMVTVAVARGFLIESESGPTWLYGTASEHCMLYQYNFYKTANLFAGMIQTESPYFQHTDTSSSPGPFKDALGVFNNDPDDFSEGCGGSALNCAVSWAVMLSQTTNVTIAGAGLYSWFDAYDQSVCVDAQNCQQRLLYDQGDNGGLWLFNLVTIGAVEMISDAAGAVEDAKANTQANAHPFWSALAVWGDDSDPVLLLCDEESAPCPGDFPCDFSKDFADLDALADAQAAGSIEQLCVPYHVVDALGNSLQVSLDAYDDANTGYDDVWGYYATGFRGAVDAMVRNFTGSSSSNNRTGGPGLQYFDCTLTTNGRSSTKQCPYDFIELSFYDTFDMKYALRDPDGFYDALNKTFGIAKDWVGFEDQDNTSNQCPGGGIGHPGSGPNPARRATHAADGGSATHGLEKRCQRRGGLFKGVPHGLDKYDVPNPKAVIQKAMPSMKDLVIQLEARQIEMALGDFNGTAGDVGEALSLPVFMMAESIEQMKQAKEKGKELKDKKDIEFIEKILGIVFMFLPFIDEFLPEALLFEGIATGVGFLGDTALAIKDIIEHPENAFMDVVGIVTDAAFLRTGKGYKDAANLRRGMDAELIKKSGKTIEQQDGKLQDIMGKGCTK